MNGGGEMDVSIAYVERLFGRFFEKQSLLQPVCQDRGVYFRPAFIPVVRAVL